MSIESVVELWVRTRRRPQVNRVLRGLPAAPSYRARTASLGQLLEGFWEQQSAAQQVP